MLELSKNWEEALGDLKIKLGETTFSTWIAPLKFSYADNQNIPPNTAIITETKILASKKVKRQLLYNNKC